MDVLNGCGRQCDTCLAASVLPSRMFSFSSLEKLFSDKKFIRMLQPSLRIGSSGDIQDHPDCADIVKMIVELAPIQTIKIVTNYRPNDEGKLDKLIKMAGKNKEKVQLCISLPFNKTDAVNERFDKYIKGRSGNFTIRDVRHTNNLFMLGRVLSEKLNAGRQPKEHRVYEKDESLYRQRGFVKIYFNPDALWLMVYTTLHESRTGKVSTPITPENLKILSNLPWHPDFPTPRNWPGGTGNRSYDEALELLKKDKNSGKKYKRLDIVK